MQRVTGIGGIFFKSPDRERLLAWYRDHLGIAIEPWGGFPFSWGGKSGTTTWSLFAAETDYLGSGRFMVNYRVDDLDAMLEQLRAAGVKVDDRVDDSEFGRFGWAHDIDGNRFELWQPAAGL